MKIQIEYIPDKKIVESKLSQFQFDPKHKTDMVSIDKTTNSLFLDIFKIKEKKKSDK